MQLQGLVAAISGGVSGLGEATARRLLAAGAKGVVLLDLNADKGKALAGEDSRILFVQTDIADEAQVDAAVALAMNRFGALHLAVHSAAIGGPAKLISRKGAIPMALFDKVMKVNLYGALHLMRAAVPAMMRNAPNDDGERGVIVNVSSGEAWHGQVGKIDYA